MWQHFKLIKLKEFYLGQCEAGFWNGHSCSTVVSQVTAWTEESKPETNKYVLLRKNVTQSSNEFIRNKC